MRMPLSWLAEYTDLAPGATGAPTSPRALVSVGLEEEDLHGGDITGPLVVGRVLEFDEQSRRRTARRSATASSTSARTARC